MLAVMLALPVAALAGDGGEMLMLPDNVIATEAQDDLGPNLGVNEAIELSEDLLVLDGLDEAAGADGQDLALADNDWE